MPPSRRDLGQRLEHEAALLHPGMRQSEPSRALRLAADVEQVDVDESRAVAKRWRSPQARFDGLNAVQDFVRAQGSHDLHGAVQEARLPPVADRFGVSEP